MNKQGAHSLPAAFHLGAVLDAVTSWRLAAQRLRNTLRLNAVTSLCGGAVAALVPEPLDEVLGTGHPGWVRIVGTGLVVFAVDVAVVAGARHGRLVHWARVVTAADVAWVLASVATIAAGWYRAGGTALVAAVAAMVGFFASRQLVAWRHARTLASRATVRADETPPLEVVHAERVVPGDLGTAWQVITDHGLYGRLAPNLSHVQATAANGPDLQRRCASRSGREWHETCTLWDEGHRYEITVDTTNYPYPLAVMRGGWAVEAAEPGHVRLVMDFYYQPNRGLAGRSFAATMQLAFPPVLRRIFNGWQAEISRRPKVVSRSRARGNGAGLQEPSRSRRGT